MSITEEADIVSAVEARRALEAFVTDNPELERLESLLAQFNIFEAIGAVRHEVRHSDFLAYLLNPQENHGLGDAFIKRLLGQAIASADRQDVPVTQVELEDWDFGAVTVEREWQRIDIFLRDEAHRFSVIIENKIDTGEHDDQLARYYARVRHEFPQDRLLALYLTKDGDEPTDERYKAIGYGPVCEAVEDLAESYASILDPDVRTLMTHYAQMLRRHIMSDTEIAQLCRAIYKQHKVALDLIYEHRPDQQVQVSELLETLIRQTSGLAIGGATRNNRYIGFGFTDLPSWLPGPYFVSCSLPASLTLVMETGPADETVRRNLYQMARANQPPFMIGNRQKLGKNMVIFRRALLKTTDYEMTMAEVEDKLRNQWNSFVNSDLAEIRKVLEREEWIWHHD